MISFSISTRVLDLIFSTNGNTFVLPYGLIVLALLISIIIFETLFYNALGYFASHKIVRMINRGIWIRARVFNYINSDDTKNYGTTTTCKWVKFKTFQQALDYHHMARHGGIRIDGHPILFITQSMEDTRCKEEKMIDKLIHGDLKFYNDP